MNDFFKKTSELYYGVGDLQSDERSQGLSQEFVHNPNILMLQAFMDNNKLNYSLKILTEHKKSIIFYKTSLKVLTGEDAVQSVNIVTLSNSPAESLYQILRQIYTPLLIEGNDLINSKLQQNITELESNLRILSHGKGNSANFNVILTIEDEVEYWKTVGQNKKLSKKDSEAANAFGELFEEVTAEIRALQTGSLSEIGEISENISGLLDDIWRHNSYSYPVERMKHIFDIIGHIISTKIQSILNSFDIWKAYGDSRDSELLSSLGESFKCVQTWIRGCQSLTETYWPNHALHPWEGGPYVPKFCVTFSTRLNEILEIKSIYHQLNKLLANAEKTELRTDRLFEPFQGINLWSNSSKIYWENATAKFTNNLRPTESKIAEKLKTRLHNASTKQILYEFMRYKMLINRPNVKLALNNELQIFLTSLGSLLTNIQTQIEADEDDIKMYKPPEMSKLIQQVQWAKQMETKVTDIKDCAENYLKEFDGSTDIVNLSTEVLKELKNMYTQLHEEWCRDLQAQVKDGTLRMSVDKPVVQFSSSSKMMVVDFNSRLVSVEMEVRGMSALGLPPPAAVKEAVDNLARFLHHARALQQVASFHNTLGERMIPSTRPMMLEAALHLSSLVQEQKAVYWDDLEQVAHYSSMLKKAVLTLESSNTYLTNQHVALKNIIEKLMDTDLLVKQTEWKNRIKEMRDIIEKVESNGYKNTELWRSHWDWQLYKALECQYIKTLLSLHKHFPHVHVDLVLRGHEVRLQPPMEEIRVQHYHQLRRLISLPMQFVGVQNNINNTASIFATIVDKHSWMGNKSVNQLESTLRQVERACSNWTRKAALACVADLDELCRQHLHDVADWEINFKACKAYGQAIAKMTFDDEKVEWISIGTATLRREFEAQVRNLWSCLISSLQASCRTDAVQLDAFIANALLTLENKAVPKNAKELSEISGKQRALQEKMPEMEKMVESLKKKSHMLHTWGGDPSVDSTIQEWKSIREMMHSQEQMFQHQAEIVKTTLNGEWANLNASLESWSSRWLQTKARYEDTHDVTYDVINDRCEHVFEAQARWETFVHERDELLKECHKFDMTPEQSDTWKQSETMMANDIKLWAIFKEYSQDYKCIAEQEWIVFNKKLHLLDEFVSNWSSRLEPYTPITLFIQQELDKYTDMPPLLKYLRGSDFTERHWREVFALLEMPYQSPDTLAVKNFMNVAPNIKKHVKELQKLCSTASSEAAIRGALTELELWFAGARLALTTYKDKAGKYTPIVKEFKEIINKIEEQQWIVNSVRSGDSSSDAGAVWDGRLRRILTLVKDTHHAQRRWLYLEPILCSDDGELGVKFRKVDLGFRQVARILETDARLSALLQSTRLQPMLDSISEQLYACQSALNDYIDEKRKIFPRFYFLSDDDLLELLGQARSGADGREAVMQNHLKKLFPGITGVKLGPGDMSVTTMCSHHGEAFVLDHPVDIEQPVEVWLKNLETEMQTSLKSAVLSCVTSASKINQDLFSLPTQVICLAQNIRFTEHAERALVSKELQKLKANIEKENKYYADVELEEECEKLKRQALILQCVHYLSIIQQLIDNNITTTNHWLWQKQLRFYLLSTKDVVAKMGIAEFSYSYEYLGINTGQFVRTELADQCFLILTQAFHLGLVGNPFGPAGTGKTESVKALGGLLGRLVLVFNCDEAMDSECMGRLLTGLALSGAWGCFDEFNRLTADTLSSVAHQFNSLLAAIGQRKHGGKATVILNHKQIEVSNYCAVAATMNPVGRGYGGRRALPAAIERVLRPAAMMEPKPAPLATNLLRARAVLSANTLADDLCEVFSMASELLSEQSHYDWGLRALKAAVGSCANALQISTGTGEDSRSVLRRVLRHNNISKLTDADSNRFEEILSVVFHDVPEKESFVDPIQSALRSSFDFLHLKPNEGQIQKCIELHEQLQQRMGIVMVGAPGSGKTTIRQLLKTALVQQGKNIVEYVISPKAMSRDSLLGHIDLDTRQWTDGVISATALEVSSQPSDMWSWVVCDGDVDPEWIEALNSVLDDNRLLTLPSGWRIQFGPNVNFLFETDNLEHASPATVSRMGIILLSEENSCAEEVLATWLDKIESDNEIVKMALSLLHKVIKKCLQWSSQHTSDFIIKIYPVSLVKQIMTHFEYLLNDAGAAILNVTSEELVYTALQRSVMCCLKESAVESFQDEIADLLGVPPMASAIASEWKNDVLYISPRIANCEPRVRAATATAHLLLTGPAACAKNILAEHVLKEMDNATIVNINCTPILQPSDIVAELKKNNIARASCGVGRGANSGKGKKSSAVILVRNIHRTHRDAWGSSAVQQFLLQIIEQDGFWEVGSGTETARGAEWSRTAGVRIVLTADVTSTAILCPRLVDKLCHVVMSEPDDDELLEIAMYYLKQNSDHKGISNNEYSNAAGSMLSIYKQVVESFISEKHYKWNASDLKKWCENMKWYAPRNYEDLLLCVSNEAICIFRDRLITDNEKVRFDAIVSKYIKLPSETLYYACKLRGTGVYMEAVDYRDWYQSTQNVIKQCLTEHEYCIFGDSGAEVCSELASLCPAMARATNGGVVVAVGSAGLGRRAAAHIVATSLSAGLFIVNNQSEFNTQMKNALSAASEDCSRVLLVVCASAVSTSILANIEATMAILKRQNNHDHIQSDTKKNLGIVIVLDKDQDNLASLFDSYPFLCKDCHVLWHDRWCQETLRQMPQLVIQRLIKDDVAEGCCDEHESIPVESFVNIYNSLPLPWMQAPCRYVAFIKTYYYIVRKKKTALLDRQKMLSAGVEALKKAKSEVASLETAAIEQEAALSEKQTAASHALDQITATVRSAADAKEDMQALKNNIQIENEKLQIRKKEIEAELASVEPVIAAARAAVGEIKTESLSEVRSLRAPPDVVRDVLEGVLRLMGIADTSWHSMKTFLAKRGVKEDIRCMDATQISQEAIASVQRLLETRGTSFEERVAKRASTACAPLAAWVRANLAYAAASHRVQPLQKQQRELHRNLKEAEDKLEALTSGLETVEERVSSLKEQLGQHTREAATLELKLSEAASTLNAARSLLGQLGNEYGAWGHDLEHISKEISEVSVRSLLAAAYLIYLTDSTELQAREYTKKWRDLICFEDADFSVINFLSSMEKQLKWDADGLQLDKSAVKNAVVIDQVLEPKKCGFTPFIIDPDGDAFAWLKNTLNGLSVDFVSQHSEKLLTAIQHALRFGRILVVTDVDNVHTAWAPLLLGLSTNSTSVPHSSSRLLLYTRDVTSLARFNTYQRVLISPVLFIARVDGLTDQLVHFALQHQDPEVNEKSRELKLKKATLQKQQYELQENLLNDLSKNSDILHDANLLASLNKTRSTSTTIEEALESARALEETTKAACKDYEASARKAAVLSLAVRELTEQRQLVVLPIEAVLHVFLEAIQRAQSGRKLDSDEVIKYFTRKIIDRVLLALRTKDKYVVVLHLLKQVYQGVISEKLWKIFIESDDVMVAIENEDMNNIRRKYDWIPEGSVKKLTAIKATCPEFFERLNVENKMWSDFGKHKDLSVVDKLKLDAFEHVIAIAVVHPGHLYRAIINFVDRVLGSGVMLSGGAVKRAAVHAACGALRPVLMLSAHASDLLQAHANQHSFTLHQVLAGDNPEKWREGIDACKNGGWLQIIIGASPFPNALQTFLLDLQTQVQGHDPEFRIWITAEDRDIPPIISNACLNVVIDPPQGIKNNIVNTLSVWGGWQCDDPKLVRTIACLALLHALAQERRDYIPYGWSRWYPFEWGDVSACRNAILLSSSGSIGFAAGLCSALYGGRVLTDADVNVLGALVNNTLSDHVFAPAWIPRGLSQPLPYGKQLQAYTGAFSELPAIDTADMLGLPANCKVAWESKTTQNIINNLKELNTKVHMNDNSDAMSSLKPLLALWKKLMSGNPLIKGELPDEKEGSGWWWCVVRGEVSSAARIAKVVTHTLAAARINRTPIHKVPEEWQMLWLGPQATEKYLRELGYRVNSAVSRLQQYRSDRPDFPKECDLRSLLRPQRFLRALRTHEAKRLNSHPRLVQPRWEFTNTTGGGVIITGLEVSGALWGREGLAVMEKEHQCTNTPQLALQHVTQGSQLSHGLVLLPVYNSEARDELVCRVHTPIATGQTSSTFTLHATALFIGHINN